MEVIKIITEFFLVSMVFSYTLFSPIASSSLTGNGFIKLISNLSIGLLVLAIIINPLSGLSFKLISAFFLIIISTFHKSRSLGRCGDYTHVWLFYWAVIC